MTSAQSMRPPVNPWMRTSGVASPLPRSSTASVTDPVSMVRSGSYMAGNVLRPSTYDLRSRRWQIRRRVGVFPGSFDPLTTAHLAIADAAIEACRLDRLDLVISRSALAKEPGGHSPIEAAGRGDRAGGRERPALRARTTDAQLIADLAEGYDVCVIGADKWHQLHDLSFYDGSKRRAMRRWQRLPARGGAPSRRGQPTGRVRPSSSSRSTRGSTRCRLRRSAPAVTSGGHDAGQDARRRAAGGRIRSWRG